MLSLWIYEAVPKQQSCTVVDCPNLKLLWRVLHYWSHLQHVTIINICSIFWLMSWRFLRIFLSSFSCTFIYILKEIAMVGWQIEIRPMKRVSCQWILTWNANYCCVNGDSIRLASKQQQEQEETKEEFSSTCIYIEGNNHSHYSLKE